MILPHTRETGEIQHGNGRLILRGRALEIFRWIDAQYEAMAIGDGATTMHVPGAIERDVLTRAGFFEAFGDAATPVRDVDGDTHLLSPALCYHAYASLAGRLIDGPMRLTTVGTCHRKEANMVGGDRSLGSLTRLWEFTMREVIFIGADRWVAHERRRWMTRVSAFATGLGLSGEMALATDPFFVDAGRGKRLMQQLKELKYELRMPIGEDDAPVAVASMNLHETFFGSRFGLRLHDGSAASSGCVAFGIERWTLALIAQLGIERATEIARATGVAWDCSPAITDT